MLRRHRLDAVEREGDLEIERLLAPQRAVIVEDGDALAGGTKSAPPCVVTRATKSVIDFFAAPSFQDGSGSAGCATATEIAASHRQQQNFESNHHGNRPF